MDEINKNDLLHSETENSELMTKNKTSGTDMPNLAGHGNIRYDANKNIVRDYSDTPYRYSFQEHENVNLSSGSLEYNVTDFVIPGKNGFDLRVQRRYNSGQSNLDITTHNFKEESCGQYYFGLSDGKMGGPYLTQGNREEGASEALYMLPSGSRVTRDTRKNINTVGYSLHTTTVPNVHNIDTHLLGHGWSFNFPSIESVKIYGTRISNVKKDSCTRGYDISEFLHLGDGRSFEIVRKPGVVVERKLKDHSLQDFVFKDSNTISTVTFNDGRLYFFQNNKISFMQDRHGNRITFAYTVDGITIVDTRGQTIQLAKENISDSEACYDLKWTLPDAKSIRYRVKNRCLESVANQLNEKTEFTYAIKPVDNRLFCTHGGDAGVTVSCVLLSKIKHPTGAETHYEYQKLSAIMQTESIKVTTVGGQVVVDRVITLDPSGRQMETYAIEKRYDTEWILKDVENGYTSIIWNPESRPRPVLPFSELARPESRKMDTNGKLETRNSRSYTFKYSYITNGIERVHPNYISFISTATVTDLGRNTKTVHTFDRDHQCEKMQVFSTNDEKTALLTKEFRYSHKYLISNENVKYNGGAPTSRSWSYNNCGDPLTITNALGQVTEMEYKDVGDAALGVNRSLLICKKTRKDSNTVIKEEYTWSKDTSTMDKVTVSQGKDYYNLSLCQTTEYSYSKCGNILREYLKDENNKEVRYIRYEYQDDVFVKQTHNGGYHSDLLVHNAYGRIIRKTDPNDNVVEYAYDALGRVTEEKFILNSGNKSKLTSYSVTQNEITVSDENGNETLYDYTPLGKLHCVARGKKTVTYKYDSSLRLWKEFTSTPDGKVKSKTEYDHEVFDRVVNKCVTLGKSSNVVYEEKYVYDDAKLIENKTVTGESPDAPSIKTTVCRDKLERVISESIEDSTVTYTYDQAGNKTHMITDYDKNTRNFIYTNKLTYDYAGRLLREYSGKKEFEAERFCETTWSIDGNKLSFTDFAGKTTKYTYDSMGRVIEQISPLDGDKKSQIKYTYDKAGNLQWEEIAQSPYSTKTGVNPRHSINLPIRWFRAKKYLYDQRNRLLEIYAYTRRYDTWLWSQGDDFYSCYILTKIAYDAVGNKTESRTGLSKGDAIGSVTMWEYNKFGGVTKMTDARGGIESYTYDDTGRLEKKVDRNGNITSFAYDAVDRVTEETIKIENPSGTVNSKRTYEYNLTGSKKNEKHTANTKELDISYQYDNRGRLISQIDPDDAVKSYSYDTAGNRERFTLVRSDKTIVDLNYTYDSLNRLQTVKNGATAIATYAYTATGNREKLTYPNGMVVDYLYNDANLVTGLKNSNNGKLLSSFSYEYSADGNQTKKTSTYGAKAAVVTEYSYDAIGRLTEEHVISGNKVKYEYDNFSNRAAMTVTDNKNLQVSKVDYAYNKSNWLKTEVKTSDKIADTYHYRYDANGNQVCRTWQQISPLGSAGQSRMGFHTAGFRDKKGEVDLETREYNGFNQLLGVCRDGKRSVYSYRPDGLRHQKVVDGNTTTHFWNGQDIVAETGSSGEYKAQYLRGIGLIAQKIGEHLFYYLHNAHALDTETTENEIMGSTGQEVTAQQSGAGSLEYFIFNAHGDVTGITDASGNLIKSYDYDSFGVGKNIDSNDTNVWRYAGEMYDRETGTYYLRARSYQPRTGRFTQEDRIRSTTYKMPNGIEVVDPLSLNLYTYCYNNPIKFVDPSGMVSKELEDYLKSKEYEQFAKSVNHDPWALEAHMAELFSMSVPNWDFDSIKFDEALVARLLFHEDATIEGQYAIAWTLQNRLKNGGNLRDIIKEYYANPQWMDGLETFFRPNDWMNTPGNQTWSKWHPDFQGAGESTQMSWIMSTHIAQGLLNGDLTDNPFSNYTNNPNSVIQYVGLGYGKSNHTRIGNSYFQIS